MKFIANNLEKHMKINPFEHNYFLGYVSHVSPIFVKIHFPSSVLLNRFIFSGEEFNGGLIGTYVSIEGENSGFLGKIQELDLPERERLELSEKAFQGKDFHPTAIVEILLSFDYFKPNEVRKGLDCFPNIGAKVFVCSSNFIQHYFKRFGIKHDGENVPFIKFGTLTSNKSTDVYISQQALFSRHCAIVGTTGGGKSWTVAKLVQSVNENNNKAILIDPTGEYSTLANDKMISVVLSEDVFFHYRRLTIEDLFYLLKPAGKVQQPKLMEAIRSLKMVELDIENNLSLYKNNGHLVKKLNLKGPINEFYYRNIGEIENGYLSFDIKKLTLQLTQECIFDTKHNDPKSFGDKSETDISNCVSLMSRTNNLLHTALFNNLFGFDKEQDDETDLIKIIEEFLKGDKNILRIGFEKVGYEFQAREILANSIAKYLLSKARDNTFKENPLVLFVDEAHQFMNKSIKDDQIQLMELNAFDQIAKECRKYGLFLCISTQMPRDIPIGTLSQMGTFIVHRLINYYDKESIASACSSANSGILSFLPVLGEGEAILTGVDFPMPVSLKIIEPELKPNSHTPVFKLSK
jgi:hypothetical protein